MLRYLIVSIGSGILFGVLDGVIHANPLARRLFAAYEPIARTSINVPAGVIIDLGYGFALAGMFLLLYPRVSWDATALRGVLADLLPGVEVRVGRRVFGWGEPA
jgi:hypothetical protein